MKKSLSSVFLIVILVSVVLVSGFQFGCVQAYSSVSGIISSDAVWTKAGGPYNLTGNVLIDKSVTVTVDADAVVNLNTYYIRVNGTLIIQPGATLNMGTMGTSTGAIQVNGVMTARGTSARPIHLNGAAYYWDSIGVPPTVSSLTFADSSLAWNEQTGSGCIIENAVIDKTGIQTSSSIKISNNQMSGAGIGVMNGSPVISNNVISNGISIGGGSPIIANNQLNGGYISLYDNYGIDSPIITSNVISNPQSPGASSTGISVVGGSFHNNNGLVLIEKNILTNSFNGIQLVENENRDIRKPITIRYNTIVNNEIGISITDRFSPTITNNNIYNNNASIKLFTLASRDVNAANNWWGTTDTSIIDRSIYDFNDDFNLGKVSYTPILTSPDPSAPDPNTPIPDAVIPYPTPSQTATPTSEPTSPPLNPTATTNPSDTQTGTPLNLDWTAIALVALLAVIAVLLFIDIVYRRRRQ